MLLIISKFLVLNPHFPMIDTFLINSNPNPIVTVMSLVYQPSETQQDQDEVKLLYMFLDFHKGGVPIIKMEI